MQKSESIKNIAGALLKFHAEVGKISKDAKNPFFKSNYASLSNIQDGIREPLQSAGLVYSQLPSGENELTTILIHAASGEYMESTYQMTPVKPDPQAKGSAISYARRYALAAILGLNVDDDDGNKASLPQNGKQQKKQTEFTQVTTNVVMKWKGGPFYKVNGKDCIYVDNVAYWMTPDQAERLKQDKRYRKEKK
jgi:hypothetical protein